MSAKVNLPNNAKMSLAGPCSNLLHVSSGYPYEPTDAVLGQLATIAPGWDRQALLAQYRQWSKGKVAPANPHGAFIGWAKRFTKSKAAA